MSESLVLRGRSEVVPLRDLLQVVGLSRQRLRVVIENAAREPLGRAVVKSGQVLEASTGGLEGRAAFKKLAMDPAAVLYTVYRLPPAENYPEPLGTLTELLLEAAVASDEDELLRSPDVEKVPSSGSFEVSPGRLVAAASPPEKRAHPFHVVGFASGKGGSGKTTVALNTALALAEFGHDVLLIDADPLGGIRHSLIGDEPRSNRGTFDVLLGRAQAAEVLIKTKLPTLTILQAGELGLREGLASLEYLTNPNSWRDLFETLADRHQLILVDLPGGVHGIPHGALRSCTHIFAVLEAEPLAFRVLPQLLQLIQEDSDAPSASSPVLAGIILNSVQFRLGASLDVVQNAWSTLASGLILETTVPRDDAFVRASSAGTPVAYLGHATRPAVARVFQPIAAEILERIGLSSRELAGAPRRLL